MPAAPLALHVLSGAVSLRAADRAEVVRSGDLIVLESAVNHEVEVLLAPLTANGEYILSQRMCHALEASARKYGRTHLDFLRAKARKAGARVKTLLLEGVPDGRSSAQAGRGRWT